MDQKISPSKRNIAAGLFLAVIFMIAGWFTSSYYVSKQTNRFMEPMGEQQAIDTPYGKVALAFAQSLASGQFEKAHDLLAPQLLGDYPPSRLQAEYEQMFSYAGKTKADDVRVINTMQSWPKKQPNDIGWAYVSISGPDTVHGGVWSEAVSVVVTDVGGKLLVREIEWGRP
jgi:hypothetical protein